MSSIKIKIFLYMLIFSLLIPSSYNPQSAELNQLNSNSQTKNLINHLVNKDPSERINAEKKLVVGGKSVVDELGLALNGKDEDLACAAATLLGEMGIKGGKELINFFRNEKYFYINSPRCKSIFNALMNIGPEIIPILLKTLSESEEEFIPYFWYVHTLLKNFGKSGTKYFKDFINSKRLDIKILIIFALRDINDVNSIPYLYTLIDDTHPCIRSAAIITISKLGNKAHVLEPKLEKILGQNEINYECPDDALKYYRFKNERANSTIALKSIAKEKTLKISDIKSYLYDNDIFVRMEAVKLLGKIKNNKNEEEISKLLIDKYRDKNAEVRSNVIKELGTLSENQKNFEVIKRSLSEISSIVRKEALFSLSRYKESKKEIFNIYLQALDDSSPIVRRQSLKALRKYKDRYKIIIPSLIKLLTDKSDIVRFETVRLIGSFKNAESLPVDKLIMLLSDENSEIRSSSIETLGNICTKAKSAINELEKIASNPEDPDWDRAINALNKIGPDSLDALERLCNSNNINIQKKSIEAIGNITPKTHRASTILLKIWKTKKSPELRQATAIALGNIGKKVDDVIDELCNAINVKESKDLISTIKAIRAIGKRANCAIESLISLLNDSSYDVKREIIKTLGVFGSEASGAVPSLIKIIEEKQLFFLSTAIETIGAIGPQSSMAVDSLIDIASDEFNPYRANAIRAIGKIGHNAVQAIPTLIGLLESTNTELRFITTDAIINITLNVLYYPKIEYLDKIKQIEDAFLKIPELRSEKYDTKETIINIVRKTIQEIESLKRQQLYDQIKIIAWNYIGLVVLIISFLFLNILFLIIWLFSPRTIIKIHNSAIRHLNFKIPISGMFNIRLDKCFLTSILSKINWTIDSWILFNYDNIYHHFYSKPIVKSRELFVNLPLLINNNLANNLSLDNLRELFDKGLTCVLINGEGGIGKTSLACQISKICLIKNKKKNLFGHPCIPIIIEDEIDIETPPNKSPFIEYIRRQLQITIGEQGEINEDFLINLLRKKRILVILDHFSEMCMQTRSMINLTSPKFPVNALIITSRLDESLGGHIPKILTPLKIQEGDLYQFLDPYLRKKDKRRLFNDKSIGIACERLSSIVGKRSITILMCKLYADQLIRHAENRLSNLPENIPSLMIEYLNELNQNISSIDQLNDVIVHDATKKVAWLCLKDNYIPTSVDRKKALETISSPDNERILDYLEKRLKIITIIGPEKTRIKFGLDPLSEYLAAIHLVNICTDQEDIWANYLSKVDKLIQHKSPIHGFLSSLNDCCKVYKSDLNIPGSIIKHLKLITEDT